MTGCGVPQREARAAGTPPRRRQTSVFDAPPRARFAVRPGTACRAFARLHRMRCKPSVLTHGVLSGVPAARASRTNLAGCPA